MKTRGNQETRDKLDEILRKLSDSLEILEKDKEKGQLIQELKNIYTGPKGALFRPYYTDIFTTLSSIDAESKSEGIDILAKNLDIIVNYFETVNSSEQNANNTKKDEIIVNKILELCDLIRFEIQMINCTNNSIRNAQLKMHEYQNNMEIQLNSVKKEAFDAKDNMVEFVGNSMEDIEQRMLRFQEQFTSWQSENVSILGIFAAIVLAFTGSMTFSSSVLQNIHKASIYRILMVALIIGFIFFNTIWALIDFLLRIINKNIKSPKRGVTLGGQIFSLVNGFIVLGILFTWVAYCIMEM